MATSVSRYDPPAAAGRVSDITDSRVGTASTGNENSTKVGSQSSSQSGTSNSTQTQTTNQTTRNMSAANEAALNRLIQELMNGGTQEMRRQSAQRQGVLETTKHQAEAYSKPAAFADAQGLIQQQMRKALESMLPSISRAAEDAGSSGGALRALLMQDAANKAAESSSALGVQTAGTYGNINANLTQVMEALTRSDPTVANALIAAFNAAKGAVVTTNGTTTTTGMQQTSQTGQQNTAEIGTKSATENKLVNTDYAPFQAPVQLSFGDMPAADLTKFIGTSRDNMAQLRGEPAPWSSYKF